MGRSPRATLAVILALVVTTASPAAAFERLRTTDRRLQALIEEGMRTSPTLHALVQRLEQSDVVVYLQCDTAWSPRVAGRLTFVSSAGGLRYVVVRIAHFRSVAAQIAILAHELQHAVEVADTPAIVDGPSLAREYQRMGYVNTWSSIPGVAFDTHAAVRAGKRVLREMSGSAAD